jgi:hypothetical protein
MRAHLALLDNSGTGGRILGDMNGAPADDCATGGAGAEFRQSHSYRHNQHPVSCRADDEKGGMPISISRRGSNERMQTFGLSASALTILGL